MKANFDWKLTIGKGKYKEKFPFKYFNCEDFWHFTAEYPYKKNSNNEEDSYKERRMKKTNFKKNKPKKWSFI